MATKRADPNRQAWMTVQDLGNEFGITPSSIYAWRLKGQFVTGYRLGKRLLFKRADVEQWILSKADAPREAV